MEATCRSCKRRDDKRRPLHRIVRRRSLRALFVFGDELADLWDEFGGNGHDGTAHGGLVFGHRLVLRLRLVMANNAIDALFVPARRKPVLLMGLVCACAAARPMPACHEVRKP